MKAFLKKEWMEWYRTGRLLILVLVFTLFGVMNPAVAKLTPWIMETLSESLAETGILTAAVSVDAMSSWAQFYKNFPVGLMIVILICSGSFTTEYQKGTLIPVVAKGLPRFKIVLAKWMMVLLVWTALHLLCFGITYAYNAYFWDNGIATHLCFAVVLAWLFGVWALTFLVFFSSIAQSSTQVLLGTGGMVLIAYLLNMFPKASVFLPIRLMDGMSVLLGVEMPKDYYASMAVTGGTVVLLVALSVVCFGRKRL